FRDMQRSRSFVLDRLLCVLRDACDETVVQPKTVDAEAKERIDVPLDVRREDPRGRLRGAAAGAAHIDDADARAARCELMGDRASDDAAADDGDPHAPIVPATAVNWIPAFRHRDICTASV